MIVIVLLSENMDAITGFFWWLVRCLGWAMLAAVAEAIYEFFTLSRPYR